MKSFRATDTRALVGKTVEDKRSGRRVVVIKAVGLKRVVVTRLDGQRVRWTWHVRNLRVVTDADPVTYGVRWRGVIGSVHYCGEVTPNYGEALARYNRVASNGPHGPSVQLYNTRTGEVLAYTHSPQPMA